VSSPQLEIDLDRDPAMPPDIDNLCPEPRSGPLEAWRKAGTLDWRKLRLLVHGEDILRMKMRVWRRMEVEPVFAHKGEMTLDENREVTALRIHRLMELNLVPDSELMETPLKSAAIVSALGMYDWSLAAKKMLLREFFISSVSGGGTDRHRPLVKSAIRGELGGAFCLTEMSHGTNSKALRTTATYQASTGMFVLHTPDFEAAKCWAGNLAKTATHASVYAQLVTEDGQQRGLHTFIVPIRDPVTLLPLPGVTIGDMGHKVGLNGLDNGWMMFDQYKVVREMLLNKTGDVSPEGEYTTPFKDPSKRFGASLGNLSGGRVGIINMANCNLHLALVIAVRYSAVRRQFGASGVGGQEEEQAVLEYQTQQRRLMPFLAACFVHHHFSMTFYDDFIRLLTGRMTGEDPDLLAALGSEVHGVSSAGKPLASWTAQAAVQECREACGGHGFLAVAGLGKLRGDNDANCTYEGDNTVLLQQTSQWLLGLTKYGRVESPMGSVGWLGDLINNSGETLNSWSEGKMNLDLRSPEGALIALRVLVWRLLRATELEAAALKAEGLDAFSVRCQTQWHLARTLSLAFIRAVVLDRFLQFAEEHSHLHPVLNTIARLYAAWSLELHEGDLAVHGVLEAHSLASVRAEVLVQCARLAPESVLLTDVLAPPDFILNSPLGHSTGDIYSQLHQAFLAVPNGFQRAPFWQEYTEKARQKAKL